MCTAADAQTYDKSDPPIPMLTQNSLAGIYDFVLELCGNFYSDMAADVEM